MQPVRLIHSREAYQRRGKGRETVRKEIARGEFPPPVVWAPAKQWIDAEVDAVVRAHIVGKSTEEIRALVAELVTARPTLYAPKAAA
jgi:predicted DNA-binding transcriptional regulator AlpA